MRNNLFRDNKMFSFVIFGINLSVFHLEPYSVVNFVGLLILHEEESFFISLPFFMILSFSCMPLFVLLES